MTKFDQKKFGVTHAKGSAYRDNYDSAFGLDADPFMDEHVDDPTASESLCLHGPFPVYEYEDSDGDEITVECFPADDYGPRFVLIGCATQTRMEREEALALAEAIQEAFG